MAMSARYTIGVSVVCFYIYAGQNEWHKRATSVSRRTGSANGGPSCRTSGKQGLSVKAQICSPPTADEIVKDALEDTCVLSVDSYLKMVEFLNIRHMPVHDLFSLFFFYLHLHGSS